ncbi:MAG: hypothetical protein IJT34_01040, partial [Butyrivibrio sp.]|nr:hypothetical protein [Butyrivibrio sp.]
FFSAMRNFYTKRDGERMAQACEWVDETVIAEKGLVRKKGLDLMQDAVRVGNEADTMPGIQGVFHKSEIYEQEAKNVVLRTCAAGIYPTWRGDHVWKHKDNDAFRAEAASRLKVPQGYKVTEQMVKDLIRLKDELKDANRFFYVNGDEYNNLVRAMEELTQVFESQPGRNVAFDSQKGQKEMLGLLQKVDAAAGEYIQTHLASRRSRHGERRFNVALMTNAILNPEANRVYTRMTELARSETIDYQTLGNRLGLKTKVEHPNHRPKKAAQPVQPEMAAQPQMAAQSH